MEFLYRFWETYPALIDLVLYFFVFGAAARAGLAKAFSGREGKILSVAVGLVLATSLTMAQHRLGFSIEKLGPIAALVLCVVFFAAVFRLLHRADMPRLLTVLLSFLVAVALARVVAPAAVDWLVLLSPILIVLVILGLVCWAWGSSGRAAERFERLQPGFLLERRHVIPDKTALKKEGQYVKRKVKGTTKKTRKEEKRTESKMEKALDLSEQEGLDGKAKAKAAELIDQALTSTRRIRRRCEKLIRLDEALCRQDWDWVRKSQHVDLGRLTPEQQKILRQNYDIERKRLKVESVLKGLESEVEGHARKMQHYLDTAKSNIVSGDPLTASGWIIAAMQEDKKGEELADKILIWEKRLLKLIKQQQKRS